MKQLFVIGYLLLGAVASVSAENAASEFDTSTVTATEAAQTLIGSRASRRAVIILNTDAKETVKIGQANRDQVKWFPLGPGQSVAVETRKLIQVVAVAGNPVIACLETYD